MFASSHLHGGSRRHGYWPAMAMKTIYSQIFVAMLCSPHAVKGARKDAALACTKAVFLNRREHGIVQWCVMVNVCDLLI